ncbi:energy-coupling factor transporter transmembrane component T family protein [Bacillus songklensis]|uniref:Energy-coupling factor transporter transmembrane protein EcfT n=1 Tax=Bacillus songklensis TaxID=1069116 RepID=A0ABV8B706_9BACI
MMNGMIIGKYVPGNSVIHRMDPRAKLLIVFFYVLVVFLANNLYGYLALGLYSFAALFLSRVPFRFILNGLKPVLFIIIFTFILHILMTKEGELLFKWGWLSVYKGGVLQGIFISFRFFFLILITTLLTLTTTPIQVTDGIESLLHPLKRFRFPVHELALMMSISLRFIPTLMDETEKIMKAQAARGIEFSSGSLKNRLQAVVPLLVPLFINSFKRAEELAIAMEARGYRGGEGRTKFRQLRWTTLDSLMLFLLLFLSIVLFFVRS